MEKGKGVYIVVELTGESIKTGLRIELLKLFTGATVYTEQIGDSVAVYPHFFVNQLTLSAQEDRRDHWFLQYLINLRYRVAAEPFLDRNLNQKLDAVGLQLLEIKWITIGPYRERLLNPRCEKVDGVLHFFTNFNVQATKEEEEGVKQEKLTKNIQLVIN